MNSGIAVYYLGIVGGIIEYVVMILLIICCLKYLFGKK